MRLFINKFLNVRLLGLSLCFCGGAASAGTNEVLAGPAFSRFSLTLAPGQRTEIVSPFFYSEQNDTQRQWAIPPLFSHTEDPVTESEEYDFIYPLLTYDRFGKEHRWQFFQLISTAGGRNQADATTHRFTLFPIYFQQRSTESNKNYTAVFPIYGHLENRLFRDEIDFVMFPGYSRTRKKDVVNYNMPYPFYNKRYGNGLYGWHIWPFTGHEHKEITTFTNAMHEPEISPGHDSRFIMWPFYTESTNGIGTTNASWQQAFLPLRTKFRSKLRDQDCWGWPLGLTHTIDREKKYEEWDAPWPLVEFAHGEGKTERRVWPFFSEATNATLASKWYGWPVYKFNGIYSPPLVRERTRILFFLYSDLMIKSTETGRTLRRKDLWPFFTYRRELNGNERLQIMAIVEPIFPSNKSIERNYGPVYALWRAEKNPKTRAESQSLLWNLYRREAAPEKKKISLLFGLFQYESTPAGKHWRVCYVPVKNKPAPVKVSATQ